MKEFTITLLLQFAAFPLQYRLLLVNSAWLPGGQAGSPPMSGYDAPVTFLLLGGLVAGASNPTYRDFHGNPTYGNFHGNPTCNY